MTWLLGLAIKQQKMTSWFGLDSDRKLAIIEACEVLQLWADFTMMYQGEFPLLYTTYHDMRKQAKQPKSDQLANKIVQMNFPKYFPTIPVLEFVLNQYEVHDYEGPTAFALTFVLRDLLLEEREYTGKDRDLVSFLFGELMTFRSRQGNNLKVLWRRSSITPKQHT